MGGTLTHDDLATRARSLVDGAADAGVVFRAVGGVGVRLQLNRTRARYDILRAVPRDIDLVSERRPPGAIKAIFIERGYEPDDRLIAWRGDRRHIYYLRDPTGAILLHVDLFIESPPACHRIDLRDRLLPGVALHPTDLLLLKLQIVEINEKDLIDAAFLLLEHPVAKGGNAQAEVDAGRISRLLAEDWGFHRTATTNLKKLSEVARALLDKDEALAVASGSEGLLDAIEDEPKTRKWRLRAKLGTRMQWYEEVEELNR